MDSPQALSSVRVLRSLHSSETAAPSAFKTINDQLKNISQIEHSRHRSPVNFCVNVLCGLIAYCHQPKKPSLRLDWLLSQST